MVETASSVNSLTELAREALGGSPRSRCLFGACLGPSGRFEGTVCHKSEGIPSLGHESVQGSQPEFAP